MSTSQKPNSPASMLILFLFGIPFAGAGLMVLMMGIGQVIDYQQSSVWEKVPAQFREIAVKTRRGSKGSTLHYLSVIYSYQYKGKGYRGNRVFFDDRAKRSPTRFAELGDQIKQSMERDGSFPVLVNPSLPDQAVVVRDVSDELILVLAVGGLFFLVGGGLMIFGLMSFLGDRRRNQALAADPKRPWRAEKNWKGFTLVSSSSAALWGTWGIALFMNLFISFFVYALYSDPSAPFFAKAVIGLFVLIAFAFLGYAIYLTLQRLKYGQSTLLLSQMPLATGQEFSAIIIIGRHLEMEKGCKVSFKCKKALTTGSGKQRQTTTTDVHDDTLIITQDLFRPEKGKSAIPVKFTIPLRAPQRDAESNPTVKWYLEVSAETPGIDFGTEFELPVYQVSDPELIEHRSMGV